MNGKSWCFLFFFFVFLNTNFFFFFFFWIRISKLKDGSGKVKLLSLSGVYTGQRAKNTSLCTVISYINRKPVLRQNTHHMPICGETSGPSCQQVLTVNITSGSWRLTLQTVRLSYRLLYSRYVNLHIIFHTLLVSDPLKRLGASCYCLMALKPLHMIHIYIFIYYICTLYAYKWAFVVRNEHVAGCCLCACVSCCCCQSVSQCHFVKLLMLM